MNWEKKHPGVCQSVPAKSKQLYEEDDWADDMELAAAQLYRITYEANYLKEAAAYGRMGTYHSLDVLRHCQPLSMVSIHQPWPFYACQCRKIPAIRKNSFSICKMACNECKNYANANPIQHWRSAHQVLQQPGHCLG